MASSSQTSFDDGKEHTRRVLALARMYIQAKGPQLYTEITYLYRNKPKEYFTDIEQNHGNIMKPYIQDIGGDPKCPINGKLNGIFFCVTLDWWGNISEKSPFGDTRIMVPIVQRLFTGDMNILYIYFTDFYCMEGCYPNHYVTLVVTPRNSQADGFCGNCLIPLDEVDIPFIRTRDDAFEVITTERLRIDVLYTEEINLSYPDIIRTDGIEKLAGFTGQSHKLGVPKTSGCNVCNV